MADRTSRFFCTADARADRFVYDLPRVWWSRAYEYAWAATFARPGDVVLDAACGVCHPLKFHLSDVCRCVLACDVDPRILCPAAILAELTEAVGAGAAHELPRRYFSQIRYTQASLLALPYAAGCVDTVFCISVLEHLDDYFNARGRDGLTFHVLRPWVPSQIFDALREFERVLKPDGQIVLTFDFPRINLHYFAAAVRHAGLAFAGDVTGEIPVDAVYSEEHRLHCYRAVLRKCQHH